MVSSTQANFPVLVSTTTNAFRSLANGGKVGSTTGADIVFTASDGITKLSHDLESYSSSSGQLVSWVSVPSLTTSTQIYMYYGNSSATSTATTSIWSTAGYTNIFHLSASSSNGIFYDSVTGVNATSSGSPTATATGKIGGGISMTSNGSGGGGTFSTTTATSTSFWLYIGSATSTAQGLIVGAPNGQAGSTGGIYFTSSTQKATYRQSNSNYASTTAISSGNWSYVTYTFTSAGSSQRMYLNGALTQTIASSAGRQMSAFGTDGTNKFGGSIDELRIASGVISPSWVITEYNNQSSPDTFWISSAEEASSTTDVAPPSVSIIAPSDSATVSSTVIFSATSTDNIGVASVTFLYGTTTIGVDTEAPFSVSWNTVSSSTPNGSYTLKVLAADAVGNSASTTITVTLSNTITKIMPLGDSITRGNWNGGYRSRLYCDMVEGGLFNFDFVGRSTENNATDNLPCTWSAGYQDHEGYGGWGVGAGSGVWLTEIDAALASSSPDIVMLKLGTNDAYNGSRTATQIRNDLSSLMDDIWTYDSDIKIILSNITRVVPGTNYNETALGVIQQTNNLLPDLVAEKRLAGRTISFVDNYAALSTSTDFDSDGVHPSVSGFLKMSDVWYPAIYGALTDTTSPTISITSPSNGATVSGVVNLTATTTENGATTTVSFFYGTTTISTATTSPFEASWDTTSLVDGSYVLKAIATDVAGNSASSTITVTVNNSSDSEFPAVSITSPSNGATVSSTISVSATSTDNVGVVGVQFKMDGSNLGSEDTSVPYSVSWDTTSVINGNHSLTAVSRDAAGNSSTSPAISVTVDNTLPTVQFSVSAGNGGEVVTPVSIVVLLSTSTYPANSYIQYSATGGTATVNEDYVLVSGTSTISSGNTTTTISLNITNDSLFEGDEVVIITLSNPTNAVLGASSTFTYTITDNDSFALSGFSTSSVTSSSAQFSWASNASSTSQIFYGLIPSAISSSTVVADVSTEVRNHNQTVSSLLSCATYYLFASSTSSVGSGASATSSIISITTSGCAGNAIPRETTSTQITSLGGSASSTGVIITVPAGAIASAATFQIQRLADTDTSSFIGTPSGKSNVGGKIYELKALTPTSTISNFSESLSVELSYSAGDVANMDEASLKLYRWDGSFWHELPSSVDTNNKTVTGTTTQFSAFGIFGSSVANSGSSGAIIVTGLGLRSLVPKSSSTPQGSVVSVVESPSSYIFKSYLKYGMQGSEIYELQKILQSEGVYSGPITGYYGNLTIGGVRAYQSKNGLPAVGVVGPATRSILNSKIKSPYAYSDETLKKQIIILQEQLASLLQQLSNSLAEKLNSEH